MKSTFLMPFFFLIGTVISVHGQVEAFIDEAKEFLAQENYRQAQLSLQDAINEINNLIANQLAESLPNEINGLKSEDEVSVNSGMMGMLGGGFQISKSYRHPSNTSNEAEVSILANAPQLSSLNMLMSNPTIMGAGHKSVRVGTQRAVMKTEMEDYYDDNGESKKIRWSEIQIPLSQTLITVNARGFASEQEELAFTTKLDIEKIKDLLGE